jgi:hypothetical protein
MAVDHLKNLRRLREILRKQRRELVATMAGARKEPTKFAPLAWISTEENPPNGER